jgi:hypothetical protein
MIENCVGKLSSIGVAVWEGGGTTEEEEVMAMPSTLVAMETVPPDPIRCINIL